MSLGPTPGLCTTNLCGLPGSSEPSNISHGLLEQWIQRAHSWHFIYLKDYTFSHEPESSFSKMYHLLHLHLNFSTHQFISRSNSRESRDDIYHATLFTTRKETEELSYSALPTVSVTLQSLDAYLHSLLLPRLWLHMQVNYFYLWQKHSPKWVPVRSFRYFSAQFYLLSHLPH